MKEEKKVVEKYVEVRDGKGNIHLNPKYLSETSKNDIDRMNNIFIEWKITKQIQYDKEGNRVN